MFAAANSHLQVVELLISKGAKVNEKDNYGKFYFLYFIVYRQGGGGVLTSIQKKILLLYLVYKTLFYCSMQAVSSPKLGIRTRDKSASLNSGGGKGEGEASPLPLW